MFAHADVSKAVQWLFLVVFFLTLSLLLFVSPQYVGAVFLIGTGVLVLLHIRELSLVRATAYLSMLLVCGAVLSFFYFDRGALFGSHFETGTLAWLCAAVLCGCVGYTQSRSNAFHTWVLATVFAGLCAALIAGADAYIEAALLTVTTSTKLFWGYALISAAFLGMTRQHASRYIFCIVAVVLLGALFMVERVSEIRPSSEASLHVLAQTYAISGTEALFGAGPGSFGEMWDMFLPVQIARTGVTSEVSSAASTLLTLAGDYGMLFILLALTFCLFVVRSFAFQTTSPEHLYWFLLLMSVYVVFSCAITVLDPAMVMVSAVTLGAFLGHSALRGSASSIPRYGARLSVVVFAILGIGLGFMQIQATKLYETLEASLETSAYAAAHRETIAVKSTRLFAEEPHTITARRIDEIARRMREREDPNVIRPLADDLLQVTQRSLQYNNNDFENRMYLGTARFFLVRLGDLSRDEDVLSFYESAWNLAPYNVPLLFTWAQVFAIFGNVAAAHSALFNALMLAPQHEGSLQLLRALQSTATDL